MEQDPTLLSFPFPFPSSSDSESENITNPKTKSRKLCTEKCGRPLSVCICPYLPPSPITTSTTILLLHHPHSLHSTKPNTLSTLPPLSLSLLNLHLIPGRRLHPNLHPLLDSLYNNNNNNNNNNAPCPSALFLFPSLPSSPSTPISTFATQHPLPKILIVFDGTWTQAREMVVASLPFLKKFAVQVSVGEVDEGREGMSSVESELAVRKEPYMGCVSTIEAVARAMGVMEGEEVEERLLGVLRAMVEFQRTRSVGEVKTRVRLKKKNKEINKLIENKEVEECQQGI